ncbi:MAG: hypothetical protein ACLQLC_05495 [Candidatus Sulfotelmatobacter sp.]
MSHNEKVRSDENSLLERFWFKRFWVAQRFSAAITAALSRPALAAGVPVWIALVACLTFIPLSFSASAQNAAVTADLPAGPMQAKATTACMECHEARIILQQRLSKAAWTKEVDKMTKWGAVVDPADRDPLIDYLSSNFSPEKPPYDPPRTTEKSGKGTK